jgi:hypothetical protein
MTLSLEASVWRGELGTPNSVSFLYTDAATCNGGLPSASDGIYGPAISEPMGAGLPVVPGASARRRQLLPATLDIGDVQGLPQSKLDLQHADSHYMDMSMVA